MLEEEKNTNNKIGYTGPPHHLAYNIWDNQTDMQRNIFIYHLGRILQHQ